jgi:hypothetical protein
MEIKQNPFSLYDFLGYFVPGALFFLGTNSVVLFLTQTATNLTLLSTPTQFDQPGFYLPFILVSYLAGHLLSFVSSITVEKYSVWKVGFPSKYLLGLEYPTYYEVTPPKTTRIVVRSLIAVFLLPISIIDITLGDLLRLREIYAKPLDATLIDIIKSKINTLVQRHSGLKGGEIAFKDVDFFRFAYHYTVENAPAHLPKMQNYVALYGFARTITMVFVLLFWWAAFATLTHQLALQLGGTLVGTLSILAFISYLNFMKFYRRFSLEVLMALSAILKSKA